MYFSKGKPLELNTAVVYHFAKLLCCHPTLVLLPPKKTTSVHFYGFNF